MPILSRFTNPFRRSLKSNRFYDNNLQDAKNTHFYPEVIPEPNIEYINNLSNLPTLKSNSDFAKRIRSQGVWQEIPDLEDIPRLPPRKQNANFKPNLRADNKTIPPITSYKPTQNDGSAVFSSYSFGNQKHPDQEYWNWFYGLPSTYVPPSQTANAPSTYFPPSQTANAPTTTNQQLSKPSDLSHRLQIPRIKRNIEPNYEAFNDFNNLVDKQTQEREQKEQTLKSILANRSARSKQKELEDKQRAFNALKTNARQNKQDELEGKQRNTLAALLNRDSSRQNFNKMMGFGGLLAKMRTERANEEKTNEDTADIFRDKNLKQEVTKRLRKNVQLTRLQETIADDFRIDSNEKLKREIFKELKPLPQGLTPNVPDNIDLKPVFKTPQLINQLIKANKKLEPQSLSSVLSGGLKSIPNNNEKQEIDDMSKIQASTTIGTVLHLKSKALNKFDKQQAFDKMKELPPRVYDNNLQPMTHDISDNEDLKPKMNLPNNISELPLFRLGKNGQKNLSILPSATVNKLQERVFDPRIFNFIGYIMGLTGQHFRDAIYMDKRQAFDKMKELEPQSLSSVLSGGLKSFSNNVINKLPNVNQSQKSKNMNPGNFNNSLSSKNQLQILNGKAQNSINRIDKQIKRERDYSPSAINLSTEDFNSRLKETYTKDINTLKQILKSGEKPYNEAKEMQFNKSINERKKYESLLDKLNEYKDRQPWVRNNKEQYKDTFDNIDKLVSRMVKVYYGVRDYSPTNENLNKDNFFDKRKQDLRDSEKYVLAQYKKMEEIGKSLSQEDYKDSIVAGSKYKFDNVTLPRFEKYRQGVLPLIQPESNIPVIQPESNIPVIQPESNIPVVQQEKFKELKYQSLINPGTLEQKPKVINKVQPNQPTTEQISKLKQLIDRRYKEVKDFTDRGKPHPQLREVLWSYNTLKNLPDSDPLWKDFLNQNRGFIN